MKRVIVDYSKLTRDILNLLVEKFPDGYDYDDVLSFKNAKGEYVDAIEVKTDDTIYLVKVSSKLEQSMEDHDYDEDDDEDDEDIDNSIEDEGFEPDDKDLDDDD